ncbi:MAG TPA: hypothetical protein VGQ62_19610 [Chloroflexota bacterium]|jgi:hypothetical protein|nr:hypothetical protein [Chloroflexota bacterium]
MDAQASELVRLVGSLRWRLGLERAALLVLRGGLVGAVSLALVDVIIWLLGPALLMGETLAQLAAVALAGPVVVALGAAVIRWPTERQAALAADARLALAERLGTAVEVVHAVRRGRFDAVLLDDAIAHASAPAGGWLILGPRTQHEAALTLGALGVAALSLLLPTLPRPITLPLDQAAALSDASAADAQERISLAEPPAVSQAEAQPLPATATQSDAELAARVQQEQAERSALNQLSSALGQISAGQPAADAIQRADFSAARDQLANLGDEADQLSDAAKQQLSKALQQAASATAATDRQLADRERQAAQALNRASYTEQRQALRNLADQVQRSGARSTSADQLARDVGRLQQQTASGPAQGQPMPAQSAAQSAAAQASNQTQADGNGAASAAAQGAGADTGGAGAGDASQQGGPGVGAGSNPNATGGPANRLLDSAGQSVNVPTRLGSGPGVRPPDGTEDQTGNDPSTGSRSVSELVQTQQTSQVAPEQNLVPGDQRPIVRGYFR